MMNMKMKKNGIKAIVAFAIGANLMSMGIPALAADSHTSDYDTASQLIVRDPNEEPDCVYYDGSKSEEQIAETEDLQPVFGDPDDEPDCVYHDDSAFNERIAEKKDLQPVFTDPDDGFDCEYYDATTEPELTESQL